MIYRGVVLQHAAVPQARAVQAVQVHTALRRQDNPVTYLQHSSASGILGASPGRLVPAELEGFARNQCCAVSATRRLQLDTGLPVAPLCTRACKKRPGAGPDSIAFASHATHAKICKNTFQEQPFLHPGLYSHALALQAA